MGKRNPVFKGKRVRKDSPTSSSVHVPAAGEEQKLPPPDPSRATERSREVVPPTVNNLDVRLLEKDSLDDSSIGGSPPQDTPEIDNTNGELNLPIPGEGMAQEWPDPDGDINTPMNLDLCSGQCRAEGFVGIDLYPHDELTLVHDLNQGLPMVKEAEANNVRWVNGIQYYDGDPKALLSEVHRVLMPGGQFIYEGPEDIGNYPGWTQEYPGLILTDHEDNADEAAVEKATSPVYRQVYTRIAVPDPATADDAEPRTGVGQYDELPADSLLAADALGYSWSDATSSAFGNRSHGYPSQGALSSTESMQKDHDVQNIQELERALLQFFHEEEVEKSAKRRVATVAVKHAGKLLMGKRRDNEKWTVPGGHANENESMLDAAHRELMEETGIKLPPGTVTSLGDLQDVGADLQVQPFVVELSEKPETTMLSDPDGEVYRWRWVDIADGMPEEQANSLHVPLDRNILFEKMGLKARVKKARVFKLDAKKRIVYGVVLIPDEVDSQDDWMTAEDIENSAHMYLRKSRVVGAGHGKAIAAEPVESYISPVDFETEGPYGPQQVKKGSWILAVKVLDNQEWQKVLDGDYQGFSVGGFGVRD